MRTMLPHWWLIVAGGFAVMAFTASYAMITLSSELLHGIQKRKSIIQYMLLNIFFLVFPVLIFIILNPQFDEEVMGTIEYLWNSLMPVILSLLYYRKNKGSFYETASAVFLCHFYITNFISVFIIFSESFMLNFYRSEYFFIQMMIPILQNIVGAAGSLLILFVLRKSNFRKYFSNLFIKKGHARLTLLVCFVLMHSERIIMYFYPGWMSSVNYLSFGLLIGFVILLVMLIAAILETNSIKLKSQETLIVQQQAYVYSLEKLQKEMRAFRHDYKNMMSGLYIQVNQGDITGTQEFLKNSLHYFEQHLGEEIRLMTQLSNIKIMEIKSVLIVKEMEMQKKGIHSNMEILKPVDTIPMKIEDFIRCIGILLDNAIEAAEGSEERNISFLMLNEEKELSITIENSYKEKPILHKIWDEGYSEKGKGRGVGLFSYQNIIEKYGNIMTRTVCNDTVFIQELRIRRTE